MADVADLRGTKGPIAGRTIAWTGDSNNVLASWVHAAQRFGFRINIATRAKELAPPPQLIDWARGAARRIEQTLDPFEAVRNAGCVVTLLGVDGRCRGFHRHNLLAPYPGSIGA